MRLPPQWTLAQLGDLTTRIVGGGTPSKALSANFKGAIPFMTVKDMKTRFVDSTVDHISEDAISSSATTMVPADTLIVATRMSLGKIVRPKIDVAINQDLKALFLGEGIEKTFIEYFWRSRAQAIQGMGTGTTVKGIRLEDIRALAVPLPPKNEQKRIADKLDTVLTRVDAINTRLARVAPLLKRFRQSVLAAATSGRLTEDWRGDGKLIYPTLPMAEIADMRLGKMLDKAKNTGVPVRYLRNVNVRWFEFDLSDVLELRIEAHERDGLSIRNGDLLVCEGGEPGRCAVWTGGVTDLIFQKALHRVRPHASVALSTWIAYVLKHLCDSGAVTAFFTGSTIKHLTGTALARVPIPVPNLDEQVEIVRRVETLFAFAGRLEARLQTAQTAAHRLTPALLAKAFRGELVPQDPNDEPASELLKRLALTTPAVKKKARQTRSPLANHA
jgi:type I restriction enzyme S subunit